MPSIPHGLAKPGRALAYAGPYVQEPLHIVCVQPIGCGASRPAGWRPREGSAHNGALRALVLALLVLVAMPAAADASTVSVEPFSQPPDIDPFGSCGRYMMCPADMVVLTAARGETNHVAITEAVVSPGQTRYLVRDALAPVVAGTGCERVDEPPPAAGVVCTAGAIGPQQLGGRRRLAHLPPRLGGGQ